MNLLIIICLLTIQVIQTSGFKEEQLKYPRVRNAYLQKEDIVKDRLKQKSISEPFIFLRLFKKEEILELWVKNKTEDKFVLLSEYEFCSSSGNLGPKRRQGDLQIPEGFYYVDRFNPSSNFYLSLGINYPNQSDRILGYKPSLGGDIFIHGDCVTIGCVPITDEKIMELYLLAIEAKNNGQDKIPVHIFPAKLSGETYSSLIETHNNNQSLINFWKGLKPGFDYFEAQKKLPDITVLASGKYSINK